MLDFAAGCGDDIAFVTPNARMATLIRRRCNEFAHAQPAAVWMSPQVMPWASAIAVLFREFDRSRRWLLSADQARALWERVIARSGLVDSSQVQHFVQLAVDAWAREHLWMLALPSSSEPGEATETGLYQHWREAFERECGRLQAVDCHRFALEAAELIPPNEQAGRRRLIGFAVTPPLLKRLDGQAWATSDECTRFGNNDSSGELDFSTSLLEYANEADEFDAALRWAADARRREPRAPVMIALADVAGGCKRLAQAARRFSRINRDSVAQSIANEIDLAVPERLLERPLIRSALLVLGLGQRLTWEELTRLLLDPHVGEWGTERDSRARFDARIREQYQELGYALDFIVERLRESDDCAAQFADRIHAVAAERQAAPDRLLLHQWLEVFEKMLAHSGWPGDQPLDDREQQTIEAWHQGLDTLASLGGILGECRRTTALRHLTTIVAQRPAPVVSSFRSVAVTSVEEALVCGPEYLWVAGLNQQAWPSSPPLNPLLPARLQREAKIPGSDGAVDFARGEWLLSRLAAREQPTHFSYAALVDDLQCRPVCGFRERRAAPDGGVSPLSEPSADALEFELIDDDKGPGFERTDSLVNAIGLFTDHAACPFRGFAKHRLISSAPRDPVAGLDAASRGRLVHAALARLMESIRTQHRLRALSGDELRRVTKDAATAAITTFRKQHRQVQRFWEIEAERLQALLEQWITVERQRGAFEIVDLERRFSGRIGALQFNVRIDRVDRLADGRYLIIDYKTGPVTRSSWEPPRIEQPQLPIYATCLPEIEPAVAGIAFAKLQKGDAGYVDEPKGLVIDPDHADGLTERRDAWSQDLWRTADELGRGHAAVDPKGVTTCRYCQQNILCRVSERRMWPDGETDDEN